MIDYADYWLSPAETSKLYQSATREEDFTAKLGSSQLEVLRLLPLPRIYKTLIF